jgi:hypothetical protein
VSADRKPSGAGRELAIGHARTSLDSVRLELSFQQLEPALAGGPLEVLEAIANRGDRAVSVPVGSDRMRRRPAFLSVSATTDPPELRLFDPWSSIPNRGGIAGRTEVQPGDVVERFVLVNDFLNLEDLLRVGQEGDQLGLQLLFVRGLVSTEFSAPSVELEITVQHDTAALIRLCTELSETLQTHPPTAVEQRERAVSQLACIASPAAAEALTTLAAGTDAHLAGLAADALTRRTWRAQLLGESHP